MSLRWLTIGILLAAAAAGCESLFKSTTAWGPADDDSVQQAVAQKLASDTWKQNSDWSPLAEVSASPANDGRISRHRWSHPGVPQLLASAQQGGAVTGPARRAYLRRLRGDPPAAENGADVAAEINALFNHLARRDELSGWNAAILWAQFDPQAAQSTGTVLARLVARPPEYHASSDTRDDVPRGVPRYEIEGKSPAPPVAKAPPDTLRISVNMQAAAAEAWCRVLGAQPGDSELALAPAGRLLTDRRIPDRVREELLRGIARRVRPDHIPTLAETLAPATHRAAATPAAVDARRAALDACVVHAVATWSQNPRMSETVTEVREVPDDPVELARLAEANSPWPAGVWSLRHDDDARIRQRFTQFVAVTRHPAALAILRAQLNDQDQHVREEALCSLGLLGTRAAAEELERQAARPEELTRVAAVRGLSGCGVARAGTFADDKSPHVRAAVARALGRHAGGHAAGILSGLLADPAMEVQLAAVSAIELWPDANATPLLLEALSRSTFRVRQTALTQLEDRRGGGLAFPLHAGPRERALRVAQLSREWSLPDSALARVRELTAAASPALDAARAAEFRERLREIAGNPEAARLAADWSHELTPDDLPVVEQVLTQTGPDESRLLITHVLPKISPAYAALVLLESGDVATRRAGASQLARLGQQSSLTAGGMARLSRLIRTEQDSLVWRSVMQAIFRDKSEPAAQTALLALNSPWPDVRVLGCEYVGHHAEPQHAAWLLPLLGDSSRAVQLAAVEAAGKCRNPLLLDGIKPGGEDPGSPGLRRLLSESQGQLRYSTVVAMSWIGDPQAMDELIRLAVDPNSSNRLEIVKALGESGQTRFIEPLIRMAWTEPHQHVKQAALDSLVRLVPEAQRPARLTTARNSAEAVEFWTAWWEDRTRT